ncbi:TPA: type 4b pilus protein PilO2 [Salmonella enterica subsp. enterica serovar Lansing]|uniref:Type 4b pilus protein PilO2 n=2 Tax=Salmonella enterica TaxID=28901 RepID=A0A734FW42_SALET|nr:pilus assembly protein PilO [Salmonella enterica]EBW6854363.1 pilus assembly protein PilO [Salmonella enterica subsp. enterica serovar Braenderup]ECB4807052.1 pilus assembly protein PilO [Salmonella enterica subsp. enterica serovar Monschaui]ECY3255246.1 type 4b pilus protein PilO2 [Salmonella enterica subsp. enterica serovar Alachua]EDQ6493650.1 type 4b pilus protein PilO2 [Salmonella enterica subsp. enterica serovar Ealing]EDU0233730.1 type 4b pilus protein PilO2 [Salmonella enterica subs
MFVKSETKKNKQKSVVNESAIRVLTINNKRFVVGLQWETIKVHRKVMQEVRKIGKAKNLDVVAIRKAEAIQAGFAPKSRQKLRGAYSLIVSLASLLEGSCIAVIPVGTNESGENEYTIVGRTEKGAIHPISDVIYPEKEIKQVVLDLKQDLRGNQQNTEIPVYGDLDKFTWVTESLDLENILKPGNIRKDFRLKPLHWGMTKNQLFGFTAALLMSGVAVFFILNHLDEQERIKRAAVQAMMKQQEDINKKARYQAALDKLKHPWITTSSIPVFLQGCNEGLKKLNLSIKGWQLATIKCSQEGMTANYNRPDNSSATADSFVAAVREVYGTDPAFNITQTSMAVFFIEHNLPPNGDDPFQNMGDQRLKIISLFQGVNIPASLTEVAIKDVKKNDEGEDLPLQDWEENTFDVQTIVPPQLVFKNDEFIGMRINSVIYEFGQDEGSVTYKITGAVYGKRILKP